VLGVSAIGEDGSVPRFSNRDRVYNDLTAPGVEILSIFPRPLTGRFPTCAEQGYSSCGPEEYREAQGTSFAAPQVSAAAAVLLSLRPKLRPEQVAALLTRSTVDQSAATGCTTCAPGHDALTGWGRLDVAQAIASLSDPLPVADRYEANDDAARRAYRVYGSTRRLYATLDFWDDQDDVYAFNLQRGQAVYVGLTGATDETDLSLALWLPGTRSIQGVGNIRSRAKISARAGSREYFSFRAKKTGTHYVQVRISSPGWTRYRLAIVKG
jgi:subtilisin family serine protease